MYLKPHFLGFKFARILKLVVKLRFRVMVFACVFYGDISSPDGSQSKLNASMYLKPHFLGFKFARILR